MTYTKKQLVDAALTAMLAEVVLQPKPGLVDPVSHGSHADMDVFTFIDSAVALRDYFAQLTDVATAFSGNDLRELFAQIRPLGVAAEQTMLAATDGVNTHKGAIFSLGLLVAAATARPTDPQAAIRQMLSSVAIATAPDQQPLTAGQQQYRDYGLTGAMGQAATGFPIVFDQALPYLRKAQGDRRHRLLDTLMLIAGQLPDSTLIKRAGSPAILDEIRATARQYFLSPDRDAFLRQLDADYAARQLSLGGAADMLILTIFLAKLDGSW